MSAIHLSHLGAVRVAYPNLPDACGRLLLLGEDNPQSAEPEHALYPLPAGCAGNRLQEDILCIRRATYLATWRTNLCNPRWSVKAARARMTDLLRHDAPWRTIIALGRKVSDVVAEHTEHERLNAFHCSTIPMGDGDDMQIIVLPHPSGRNLIWNDPSQARNARALLREVAPEYPWGEALS